MWRAILVLGFAGGCASSPGKITNARFSPAQLANETQSVFTWDDGLVRRSLDGAKATLLFSGSLELFSGSLEAMSDDAHLFAFGDKDTNLFVVHDEDGVARRIPELDGHASEIAIAPDDHALVVSRHADFSKPQSEWVNDDALYLVDARTYVVRTLPKSADERVDRIAWSRDGASVLVETVDDKTAALTTERVDLASARRTKLPGWPAGEPQRHFSWRRSLDTCPETGQHLALDGFRGDHGIVIEDRSGRHPLVRVEGRVRGFHDYQATIDTPTFTGSCRYVVFTFNARVWVADVATHAVAMISSSRETLIGLDPVPVPARSTPHATRQSPP
jgi:dipeptidyl aminopeptidase/acylaminoacyl peptidase